MIRERMLLNIIGKTDRFSKTVQFESFQMLLIAESDNEK